MRTVFVPLAVLAVLGAVVPAAAAPNHISTTDHQLAGRATRSSQGWYSYGCYFDCYNGMERQLPYFAYSDTTNEPDKCIATCIDAGYKYAGLQFGKECWCGSELKGIATAPTDCNMRCEDGKSHCGGGCCNNVWSEFQKPGH
ncbi:hypothetical protein Q5752_002489 [Cryptotrichosporon argae]